MRQRRGWRARCRSRARCSLPSTRSSTEHAVRGRLARVRAARSTRSPSRSRDDLLDRLGGADRLEQPALGDRHVSIGTTRHDRFGDAARAPDRAVVIARAAEPPRQRAARQRQQIGDALEAEAARGGERRRAPAASAATGSGASACGLAAVGTMRSSGRAPKRASAWAAPGVPATAIRAVKPQPSAETEQAPAEALLAAEQMGGAGQVEPEPVGAADGGAIGVQWRTACSASRSSSARSASGSAGRMSRSGTSARAWVTAMPGTKPEGQRRWTGDAISSRWPTCSARMSGAADGAGGPLAATVTSAVVGADRLNGWSAASERRPSSRIGGCWWRGSARPAAVRQHLAQHWPPAPSARPAASRRPAGPSRHRGRHRRAARKAGAAQAARAVAPAAAAARSRAAAGRARRPVSSQASTRREKGLPLALADSSTDQRGRPTPGAASRADGAQAIRQRVVAAESSARGQWPWRRQRREGAPASCRRRRRAAAGASRSCRRA